MAFDTALADRVRGILARNPALEVIEKKMFGGLAFLVNKKMCVNISGDGLMCRFDPTLLENLSTKPGFEPMIMRGKQLDGYCRVDGSTLKTQADLEYWVNLSLAYNRQLV